MHKGIFYKNTKTNKYVTEIEDISRHYLFKIPKHIHPDSIVRFLIIEIPERNIIVYYDTRNKLNNLIDYFLYQIKRKIKEQFKLTLPTEKIPITQDLINETYKNLTYKEKEEFKNDIDNYNELLKAYTLLEKNIKAFPKQIKKIIPNSTIISSDIFAKSYPELYKLILPFV